MKQEIILEEVTRLREILLKDKRKKEIPHQTKRTILDSLLIIENIIAIKKGTKEYESLFYRHNIKREKEVRKEVHNRKKTRGICTNCSKPSTEGVFCWYHSFMNNLNNEIRRSINGRSENE